MVRWCWVNFQCRGVLLIWIRVGQGPTVLAVGAGGGCLDIFTLVYHFSSLSPSLWETARYILKYCLKGSLSPKQPTNQPTLLFICRSLRCCLCQSLRIISRIAFSGLALPLMFFIYPDFEMMALQLQYIVLFVLWMFCVLN